MTRVVRTDGTAETGWKYVKRTSSRIMLEGPRGELKMPTYALYEHWQEGGMCRSSEELAERVVEIKE